MTPNNLSSADQTQFTHEQFLAVHRGDIRAVTASSMSNTLSPEEVDAALNTALETDDLKTIAALAAAQMLQKISA